MASLDDFQTTGRVSLDDFAIEGPLLPLGNEASNLNLAAFTAALSEDPNSIEATYLDIAERLNQRGDRELAQQLLESARGQVREKGRKAFVGVMTDPSLSDEQKQAATNAYMDDTSSLYDIQNIASTEALVSESDPDETEESETARINFAETLEEANSFRSDKQALLNRELAKNNQEMLGNIVDFVEIMVPFVEGSVSGRTLSKMRDGDAASIAEGLAWTGGSKAEIRDAMKGLPIDKRRQAMKSIVEAVNSSSSVIFPGDNEFARGEMLRVALEDNSYGTGEEWLDNSIAILDMIGLFGIARRGTTALARKMGVGKKPQGLNTPEPSVDQEVADRPYVETASDEELRAAEDAAEASATDRNMRAEEDASEERIQSRQRALATDPVRRAEDAAERRAEARRAVREPTDDLARMEDAEARRAEARRTGGAAARMTDEELRMAEDAAETRRLNMEYKASVEATRAPVQPMSYSQTLRNTNPAKARAVNEAVTADNTGQVAKATYGASRADAIAHDHLPEVKQLGGETKNKVSHPDTVKQGPVSLPKSIKDAVDSNGAIYYSEAQKVTVASRVVHDFNNATGLTARTEMTVPLGRDIGGQFKVGVTYGPRDNGWANAREGAEKIKNSLRAYGIRDDDLTVLGRQGDEYVPTDIDNPVGTDFLVRVDYDYPLGAAEVGDLTDATDSSVLFNFFDRIPHTFGGGRHGTLTRTFLDPASLFDKHLLGGAAVAATRAGTIEKRLGDLVNRFSGKFNKLSSPMQKVFDEEIRRANLQGWNKSRKTLKAEGWDDVAIEALDNWREAWDAIYWLENTFLAKNLRNNGYGLFVDSSTDSRLFVKEFKRGGVGSHTRAYDPKSGKMENLDEAALDELYEKGGSVGRLKSKFMMGQDEAVETIIVRNQPESYVRRIRDDDQALNYREGYYTVYYDAPRFVDEVVFNRAGQEVMRKAVSTARDISTASRTADRLNQTAPDNVTYVARDAKERQSFSSDDTWSLQEASGRVAQKVRGERLADSSSMVTDEMSNHVLGPADALIKSIRSVAPKTAMGDMLDAMKLRTVREYGHMFPKDRFNNPTFPKNSGQIDSDMAFGAEAAQARSLVEYINSLERPYINMIDDGVKYFFRAMADASGRRNLSYLERASEFASEVAQPTRLGKGTAFTLYLALNPLRQALVQSFQATQLLALAPGYATTQLGSDMAGILTRRMGQRADLIPTWTAGRSKQDMDEMYEAFELSGSTAIIDKSNLVKGTLQEVADATAMGGRRSIPGQVSGRASQAISAVRIAGFDAGETMNKLSSWVTHYHLKKQEVGDRKLTKSEIDEVTFKSENWTYMMNRSGEMPYNENTFGMVAQFLQVPHKAFLTMTTNRHLSWKQKARLTAFNLAFFGAAPGSFLYAVVGDKLPTAQEGLSAEARDAFMQGLGAYLFNRTVGSAYEFISDDKRFNDIDFSSLRAIDGEGLWEFITDLGTTDAGEIIANTPAGSLVMGYNPRVANAIKKTAEFFHFREPDDGSIANLSETLETVASMSSGMSSYFKARKVMRYNKKYNAEGGVTMTDVHTPTAIAQLFGLNTVEEANKWYSDNELYEKTKAFEDDVKERYRLMAQDLFREGMKQDEEDYAMRVLNYINEEFAGSQRAQEIMLGELKKDVRNGKDVFMLRASRAMEQLSEENPRGMINAMPLSDERKAELHQLVDDIKAIKNEE